MADRHRCPRCSYPLTMPQTQGTGVAPELVESLFEEIRRLRETVVALRGTGAVAAVGDSVPPVRAVPRPAAVVATGCGDRYVRQSRKAS